MKVGPPTGPSMTIGATSRRIEKVLLGSRRDIADGARGRLAVSEEMAECYEAARTPGCLQQHPVAFKQDWQHLVERLNLDLNVSFTRDRD